MKSSKASKLYQIKHMRTCSLWNKHLSFVNILKIRAKLSGKELRTKWPVFFDDSG